MLCRNHMTAPAQAPLIFFNVVADPACRPAALLFASGAGDAGTLARAGEGDMLASLASATDCLYPDTAAPELAAVLEAVGFRAILPDALFLTTSPFARTDLPHGARYVGGNWYLTPPPQGGTQATSRALALQLVQKVAGDADNHEIEALLRRDPALSYHLLRLVNSLGMGATRKITSFSQALLILGRTQLRRWLNLMLFAARDGDMRSAMLLARVAVRARAIELLARAAGLDRTAQEQGFMTGMFSLLGVLFGMPLSDVLAPLPIGAPVKDALLRHEGELGVLLLALEQAECGQFERVAGHLAGLQVSAAEFNEAMVDATLFMLGVVRESGGSV